MPSTWYFRDQADTEGNRTELRNPSVGVEVSGLDGAQTSCGKSVAEPECWIIEDFEGHFKTHNYSKIIDTSENIFCLKFYVCTFLTHAFIFGRESETKEERNLPKANQ